MKANEFVKKFGVNKAKGITCVMASGTVNYDGISVDYDDLKRLVESHELVESYGGLGDATKVCIQLHCKGEDTSKLKQAIADVESCQ